MRFLVECTFVYDFPEMNSGIQRVVRNVIREIEKRDNGPECIPVIFKDGKIYRVHQLAPKQANRPFEIKQWLEKKRQQYWMLYWRTEKKLAALSFWPLLRGLSFVIARIVALPLPIAISLFRFVHPPAARATLLEYNSDDTLLLLDSSWQSDFFSVAEKMKRDGVKIISVIYDLIPVTHPQFCEAGLVNVFLKWIIWIAQTADGFMAISKTISDQTRAQVVAQIGEDAANARWHDYFYLGSELDLTKSSSQIRSKVIDGFRGNAPIYLMVSTIEPRKNHHYLIDAFELLWNRGIDVKLCFVGKVGWKCTDLMKRTQSHTELNKRFFVFNDLSDTELEYCYKNAKALTLPSFVEGFGLPIVEAMQRGLPVMASDIPIFREVGSDFIAYFDLENSSSLAELVTTFEATKKFPAPRDISEWRWINWSEAAEMLISKVLAHVEPQRTENDLSESSVTRANYS